MLDATSSDHGTTDSSALTPPQIAYFEAFGFLVLPALFEREIASIGEAFDRIFDETPPSTQLDQLNPELVQAAFASTSRIDSYHHLHRGEHRAIIPEILGNSPELRWLQSDPRILGLAESLLGPGFEDRGSDGNLLDCDTSWHCDVYDAPLEKYHIKILFYLDPLEGDTGALRVIPGTHHYNSLFAQQMRRDLDDWAKIDQVLGVAYDQIPSFVIPSRPGDVIVLNFRTMHATFHGAPGRRLFTQNYRSTARTGPGGP